MSFWSTTQFADITHGRWLHKSNLQLTGVSIDTRTITAGNAFIALPGQRFDGHDYLQQAAGGKAALLIVQNDHITLPPNIAALHVDDTHHALQQLAGAYRDELSANGVQVIAVAGSNGKTTTRHLIHAALSAKLKGTQSPKSFNNHIGVPLTLLGASCDDDFVVVEVGTNHPGELDALGKLVRPDIAVITGIGLEHLEFFKTLDGVANEEASIAAYVRANGAVIARHDAAAAVRRFVTVGPDVALIAYSLDDAPAAPLVLVGNHNRENAAAARLVAQRFNIDDTRINAALKNATGVPMRMQRFTFNRLTVINDAYNANPDSMRCAIQTLCDMPCPGRRVIIMGDMLELGDTAPALHADVGRSIAATSIDSAIFIGPLAAHAASRHNDIVFDRWSDDLPDKIAAMLHDNDTVLIKASRSMRLERIVPALEARCP